MEVLKHSQEAAELLDCIDAVRNCLIGQSCFEEMMEQLPQFVAVGAQSAGKSSVMRRISGVSLPEASGMCTRIATVLQLRRKDTDSINVRLIGQSDDPVMDVTVADLKAVEAAVAKAQDLALTRRPEATFVQDHHIEVLIAGRTCPNVTLVDLPGFHNVDDDDAKTVNTIVKRYVSMQGTLVMHVVKGDQDYASVLGNDFMRKLDSENGADRKRITVLTHCDKMHPGMQQDDADRLRSTIDTVDSAYAIHGPSIDCAKEQKALAHLETVGRLELGRAPLVGELERVMHAHVEKQFPIAIATLQVRLEKVRKDLEAVRKRPPMEVAHRLAARVQDALVAKQQQLLNGIREVVDEVSFGIKRFTLSAEGQCFFGKAAALDLETGEIVRFYKDAGDKFTVVSIVSVDPLMLCKPGGKPFEAKREEVYTNDRCTLESITGDIEKLAKDRGMRNLEFVDPHPFVVKYAKEFACHYTKIITEAANGIQARVAEMYDDVFSHASITEVEKTAAAHMRNLVKKGESEARLAMEADIAKLKALNTEPELVFTTNDHYLDDLIRRMMKDMKPTEPVKILNIYCSICAYIKVQRKAIVDDAAKLLVKNLVLDTKRYFVDICNNELGSIADSVKEPPAMERKRDELSNQAAALEKALEKAPAWMLRASFHK